MTINLQKPDITELKPRITVYGVGGGGGNAVNNMITGGLEGVEFVVANTDAQALTMSKAERIVQMGIEVTAGLGAGSQPEIGRAAAEECLTEITDHLAGTHMAFVTAGMGGGTGTGAAPVVARAAREMGILTVGVVTKPFHFEGQRRMKIADAGICELQKNVDTLIVIPNQNLFRIANDKTTFADAFGMADQVLYSGVACITDLMVKEGLINLDFADVRSVMNEMGKAMMGTGEASGDGRAIQAAEAAISNPLLDESSMIGAQGLLISITGGRDMTLFEVDEAATRIREEVDSNANIILGATFDEELEGTIRVSVVATGIDSAIQVQTDNMPNGLANTADAANGLNMLPSQIAQKAAPAGNVAENSEQSKRGLITGNTSNSGAANPATVEKNGVRIEPFQPQNSIFTDIASEEEFRHALEEELLPKGGNFIPPSAETVDQTIVAPVIPDIRDFPPIARAEVARAELKAKSKPVAASEDRGPMGLLKKLKSGFGVQEVVTRDQAPDVPEVQSPAPVLSQENNREATPAAPIPAAPVERSLMRSDQTGHAGSGNVQSSPDSPYAPKRNNLDQNGRIVTTKKSESEDDQLDIPAFLRRQAN